MHSFFFIKHRCLISRISRFQQTRWPGKCDSILFSSESIRAELLALFTHSHFLAFSPHRVAVITCLKNDQPCLLIKLKEVTRDFESATV